MNITRLSIFVSFFLYQLLLSFVAGKILLIIQG